MRIWDVILSLEAKCTLPIVQKLMVKLETDGETGGKT